MEMSIKLEWRYLLCVFLFTISFSSFSTTWDEPWRKDILNECDYYVFTEIIESSDSLVKAKIKESFDSDLKGEIIIDDFYMLELCSNSAGHGPEFNFEEGQEVYFFLKEGENGNYQLPTPTSGFDIVVDDKIHATYRHSYHKAAVNREIYNLTYELIWQSFKGKSADKKRFNSFSDSVLALPVAGFDKKEINTFFNQHAALETAYLCEIELKFDVLKRFIMSENFHAQVAGLRAVQMNSSDEAKEFVLKFIKQNKSDNFTTVIAIQSLWNMGDEEFQKQLVKLADELSDEETKFQSSLMDPRICTHFPSPKSAIKELNK